jgi:hypothetical protein
MRFALRRTRSRADIEDWTSEPDKAIQEEQSQRFEQRARPAARNLYSILVAHHADHVAPAILGLLAQISVGPRRPARVDSHLIHRAANTTGQ